MSMGLGKSVLYAQLRGWLIGIDSVAAAGGSVLQFLFSEQGLDEISGVVLRLHYYRFLWWSLQVSWPANKMVPQAWWFGSHNRAKPSPWLSNTLSGSPTMDHLILHQCFG
jgi:hypothetical protein